MSNQDIYQNGRYYTFYCKEQKKWIVCVVQTNIKSKVLYKRDTFQDAKDCVDSGGAA